MNRVGIGVDVHQFADDRPLIIGGVEIDHPRGLVGHSDADVLAHAVADALLGAAALGDIGKFYPDTDQQWKDLDSMVILDDVAARFRELGIKNIELYLNEASDLSRFADDSFDVVDKTHIQHAIGFVEDKVFDGAQ